MPKRGDHDIAVARRLSSRKRLSIHSAMVALAIATIYFGAATLGLAFALQAEQVTAVWPATGLALVAVLKFGRLALPGILIGAFTANVVAQAPPWVALGIACGNLLEAAAGAMLLRRLHFTGRLDTVRDVFKLLSTAALAPVLSATLGVACLVAGAVQPAAAAADLWETWWVGDMLGIVVIAPVLLPWLNGRALPSRRAAVVEANVIVAVAGVASWLAFRQPPPAQISEYIVFPFLIWAGLSLGPATTAAVLLVSDAVAVWSTLSGFGPFAQAGREHGLVPLQIFIAIAGATGLLLAAIAAQRAKAQKRADERAAALHEADLQKDRFLATLAHELRNPLATIGNSVNVLRSHELSRDKRELALGIMRRQTNHLVRLIDDLLETSRISTGTFELRTTQVEIKQVLDQALDVTRPILDAQRHLLTYVPSPQRTVIEGDLVRLVQVFTNLLANAAKYTPPGGHILLTTSVDDTSLTLSVKDDGIGIAPVFLESIFQMFFRTPESKELTPSGLGVGLALSRKIVELHGGSIRAFSDGSGRGSEFRVVLPIASVDRPR